MAVQGSEVCIVLDPFFLGKPVFESVFEAIEGPFDLPLQRIKASDVVERHGLRGVHRQGAARPFQPARRLPQLTPYDRAQIEGAGIVRV